MHLNSLQRKLAEITYMPPRQVIEILLILQLKIQYFHQLRLDGPFIHCIKAEIIFIADAKKRGISHNRNTIIF
jgi:hypothetical protein